MSRTGLGELSGRVSKLAQATSVEDVDAQLARFAADLGFRFYALAHHADLARLPKHALLLHNYPRTWVETYSAGGLHRHDPARRLAAIRPGSFAWSDLPNFLSLSPQERGVLTRAHEAGLGEGFTVGLYAYGERPASCSFVTARGKPLPTSALPVAEIFARSAFVRLFDILHPQISPRRPQLSARQEQCVILMAQGKTDAEIAIILGISEETVSEYINDARRRLGVTRRSQLAAAAVSLGLISAHEVLLGGTPP